MSLENNPLPVLGRRKIVPDAVEAALTSVNGRAKRFGITSFQEVEELALAAEQDLEDRGVPKGKRDGAVLYYRPAGPGTTPRSRKGTPIWSTMLKLRRQNGTWLLERAKSGQMNAHDPEVRTLSLPREALHAVLTKALRGLASIEADPNSFEGIDLAGFLCALADTALPESLNASSSAHAKISAIQVVENLIAANSPPAR